MASNPRKSLRFRFGWVACVLLAAMGEPMLATLAVAVMVAGHLAFAPVAVKEAALLVTAAVLGLTWESFLVYIDIVRYPGHADGAPLAPYWVGAMWILLAMSINHGLRWIKRSGTIAAATGLFAGPVIFLGAAGAGVVEFSNLPLSLTVISAGWAVLLPALALVADTIVDSAWLEPRDGLLIELRPARTPGPLNLEPVRVPVTTKEINRVR